MQDQPSYRRSVRILADALCKESRSWTAAAGGPEYTASAALDLDDYFLTITEKALETVPNAVLISILSGRTRLRLEQAGFDMDRELPLSATIHHAETSASGSGQTRA